MLRRDDARGRFFEKVDKGGDCWLWLGARNKYGYGRVTIRRRGYMAHRVAYDWLVGPIPAGHQIDHVKARGCRHRHCVNPAHLEPVTIRENLLRGETFQARNAAKTHCLRGHALSADNLTQSARRSGRRECRTCKNERIAERRREGRWR
jgi:hypothetical protein